MNIKKILSTKEAYDILDDSNAKYTTWLAGGCKILADALNMVYYSEIYVIYNKKKNVIEHFGVLNDDGNIIDGDGVTKTPKKWLKNFSKNELVELDDLTIKKYIPNEHKESGIQTDVNASKKLADLIKTRLNIQEEIDKFLMEEYPESFNMEEFKILSSFNARKKYCDEHLMKLGAGSGRITYVIDNEKVLKLAKNKKGVAQNDVEIQHSNDYLLDGIVAETYDYHEDALWVEAERCKKLTKPRFKQIVGIGFDEFAHILNYEYHRIHTNNNPFKKPKNYDEIINDEDFELVRDLIDYIGNYNVPVADFTKLSSYGENTDGEIVIIDYGYTNEVRDEFYS